MRLTQGTFSFLPDLTDDEISKQIQYCLNNEWALAIEYTDDPHPRNTYWEMYGMPLFDLKDASAIMMEFNQCRNTFPDYYIRIIAYNSTRGTESIEICFIANRPKEEAGFDLIRTEKEGRNIGYTTFSYEVGKNPSGKRYK